MADLDDFFAKKDKKKKTKKGFSKGNAEVLAKNLEENERREQKADEKASPLATSEATKLAFEDLHQQPAFSAENGKGVEKGAFENAKRGNDEEWLDYDNEKKDYSGLKIETLRVTEKDSSEEPEHEINEEGEKVLIVKKDGGVWNKSGLPSNPSPEPRDDDSNSSSSGPAAPSKPAPSAAPAAAPASGAGGETKSSYVPPHMRGGGGAPSPRPSDDSRMTGASGASLAPVRLGAGGGNRMVRNRAAPNINSEVNFPTLSSATSGDDKALRGRKEDFQEVRSGGSSQYSNRNTEGPRLALGNKFAALRD